MIGDKPDIPWQNGWDVLIPWEYELAMRQKEREELLEMLQGQAGAAPTAPGLFTRLGSAGFATTTTPTTTAATSTGGA